MSERQRERMSERAREGVNDRQLEMRREWYRERKSRSDCSFLNLLILNKPRKKHQMPKSPRRQSVQFGSVSVSLFPWTSYQTLSIIWFLRNQSTHKHSPIQPPSQGNKKHNSPVAAQLKTWSYLFYNKPSAGCVHLADTLSSSFMLPSKQCRFPLSQHYCTHYDRRNYTFCVLGNPLGLVGRLD